MKTHSLILMKNIHVIATDKPSRLYYNTKGKCYAFSNKILSQGGWVENQNIYITSETEAKRIRDYVYDELSKKVVKITNDNEVVTASQKGYFKVILTTDTELIADGVQTIDDDFLEWFVKNPSCEFVEVVDDTLTVGEMYKLPLGVRNHKYKIIIPKEEQKQNLIDMMQDDEKLGLYDETLEEVSFKFYPEDEQWTERHIFTLGAKWQKEQFTIEEQSVGHTIDELDKEYIKGFNEGSAYYIERMYSEDEVRAFAYNAFCLGQLQNPTENKFNGWFEQFKKK